MKIVRSTIQAPPISVYIDTNAAQEPVYYYYPLPAFGWITTIRDEVTLTDAFVSFRHSAVLQ